MFKIKNDVIKPCRFKSLKPTDIFFIADSVEHIAYMKFDNCDFNSYNAVNLHNGILEKFDIEHVIKIDRKLNFYPSNEHNIVFYNDIDRGDYFWMKPPHGSLEMFIKFSYHESIDLRDGRCYYFDRLDIVSPIDEVIL